MATLQYNTHLSRLITVRLFLRIDLARGAAQNVEQQMEGRDLKLNWDKTAILNFALARVASLKWFQETFGSVCRDIENRRVEISRAGLSESEAEELLLRIFPKSLDRNKLKTTTFFASYFSDIDDSENKTSFYPRLFDNFFRQIDTKGKVRQAIKDGRLNSPFVLQSYDAACADFLEDVRTELHSLLTLAERHDDNKGAVNRFIESFSGKKTPFLFEEIVKEISSESEFPPEKVRKSLLRMKRLGIFEDRPGYAGWWRTGRVYKSGLKMKYVRSTTPGTR